MERNTEIFNFLWVGRGKGKRLFRLGFLRGGEEVQKYGAERPRTRTGAAVRSGSLGVEDF